MSWLEKLDQTRAMLSQNPELAIVFSESLPGASETFIGFLRKEFPFVDEQYLDFLRNTNGVQIDMFVLFGSEESVFPSVIEGLKRWTDVLHGSGALPIGEDPSGSCIAMSRDHKIILVSNDPPDPTNTRVLAADFGQFLDEVLMGPRFPQLFPGSWTVKHENEWTEHMRQQGWL